MLRQLGTCSMLPGPRDHSLGDLHLVTRTWVGSAELPGTEASSQGGDLQASQLRSGLGAAFKCRIKV